MEQMNSTQNVKMQVKMEEPVIIQQLGMGLQLVVGLHFILMFRKLGKLLGAINYFLNTTICFPEALHHFQVTSQQENLKTIRVGYSGATMVMNKIYIGVIGKVALPGNGRIVKAALVT